ncbi:MAG: GrpB family protein, partial [Pseudomonadota bacterium]
LLPYLRHKAQNPSAICQKWIPMSRRIEVVAPNPAWPEEYQAIKARIATIDAPFLRIDHIGSTAVPELAAKDVIDVQITVAELASERVSAALPELGYLSRVGITHDLLTGLDSSSSELAKRFCVAMLNQRAAHIHIREQGRLNQVYPLLFRDFLRANPTVRDAYAEVKIQLAARFTEDVDAYYAIKDPYMDTVYFAAQLWAEKTGWEVPAPE